LLAPFVLSPHPEEELQSSPVSITQADSIRNQSIQSTA
jgi:hypothetical protein